MSEPNKSANEGKALRVKWKEAPDMGPTYAEEVHYMDLGDRVIITFGQVQFPLALQEIAEGTELAIQPVIRIVMPRVAAQKMVELFQKGPFSSKAETEK